MIKAAETSQSSRPDLDDIVEDGALTITTEVNTRLTGARKRMMSLPWWQPIVRTPLIQLRHCPPRTARAVSSSRTSAGLRSCANSLPTRYRGYQQFVRHHLLRDDQDDTNRQGDETRQGNIIMSFEDRGRRE
jgi:hypothetical protein